MRTIRAHVGVVLLSAVVALTATASDTAEEPGTTGTRFVYAVQQGETLTSIGARFGIDVRSLRA